MARPYYQLPAYPASGDPAFNQWGADVVKALDAIRRDVTRDLTGISAPQLASAIAGLSYTHPFKMSLDLTEDPIELDVYQGQASLNEVSGDGTPNGVWMAKNSEMVELNNEPLTATVGVWLKCEYNLVGITYSNEYRIIYGADLYGFSVIVDTTNTEPTNFAALNTYGEMYHYIGKAELLGDGVTWVLHQHLKSDTTFGYIDNPADYVSNPVGETNRLEVNVGGDNLLKVIHNDENTRDAGEQ